ncbi:MAG: hypothetical protein K8R88_08260 [Armatimonadetes bacterium]|nr:hypothetical protein [Armatimonadota bacterium]
MSAEQIVERPTKEDLKAWQAFHSLDMRTKLDFFRERHPSKKSDWGAVLAEIVSGEEQARAAHVFFIQKYKRGLRQLEKIASQLIAEYPPNASRPRQSWGRADLSGILFAIGHMDTPQSHAYLVSIVRRCEGEYLKGDCLTAMAWEKEQFDVDFVLQYLDDNQPRFVLLSAIYALDRTNLSRYLEPTRVAELMTPFLHHEDRMVRSYAINLLQWDPFHKELLSSLASDPDEFIRLEVADALRQIENIEQWKLDDQWS